MPTLMERFRAEMRKDPKKSLGAEARWRPTLSTGFDVLDYRNGKIDLDTNELQLGVASGRILTIIGRSHTGKTTLVVQIAKNIVMPFEDAQVFHLDFERATDKDRVRAITGLNSQEFDKRYMIIQEAVSSDQALRMLKKLSKMKQAAFAEMAYETDRKDERTGKPIMELPPSVVIIDSLAAMAPDDIEEKEDAGTQMDATRIAKANSTFFKRALGPLFDGNIILLVGKSHCLAA